MAIPTDDEYAAFQRQIELQKECDTDTATTEKVKEKVDEDGTTYVWDEIQRAWFPKISQGKLWDGEPEFLTKFRIDCVEGRERCGPFLDRKNREKFILEKILRKIRK